MTYKFFPTLFLLTLVLLLTPSTAHANNLVISNVSLTNQDSANQRVSVQFDISWDNSWRNQTNWDAVWVFIKYTTQASAPYTWKHVTLYKDASGSQTNPSSYSRGSGTELDILVRNDGSSPNRAHGAMLYRSDLGYGSVSTTAVQLVWNYGHDGLANTDSATVKVFGIEMVYIPQAAFYLGDGTNNASNPPGGFRKGGSATYEPFLLTSIAGNITLGSTASAAIQSRSGMGVQDDFTSASTKNLSGGLAGAGFPRGYFAFYVMKYEITQGQYTEFLNTLERSGQRNRIQSTATHDTITNIYVMSGQSLLANSNRNTITAPATGNTSVNPITFSVSRPYRAMNYMSWMDLAAYADWAALRPMSELEYEKVARGGVTTTSGIYPTSGEYAWGSIYLVNAVDLSGCDFTGEGGTETIETAGANAAYGDTAFGGINCDGGKGPLRSGLFAASASSPTRALTGAGFYGAMELSGNVAEQVVTIGNSTASPVTGGRNFVQSQHGDGILESGSLCTKAGDSVGHTGWPGYSSTTDDLGCVVALGATVSQARGAMRRGGGWSSASARLRLSDRFDSSSAGSATRDSNNGGRLVRVAP